MMEKQWVNKIQLMQQSFHLVSLPSNNTINDQPLLLEILDDLQASILLLFLVRASYITQLSFFITDHLICPMLNIVHMMSDIIFNQFLSDCYSCESSFSSTVMGSNTVEPLYDDIKELDKTLCWETYEPKADTSVTYTGTSGSCEGKCYASAYKYKG